MNEPTELNNPKLSNFYNESRFASHVEIVKFLLMPFVFFVLFGFPVSGIAGNYVNAISHFAELAFFLFCGFFTLTPDPAIRIEKLKRALKRSWLFFLILFLCYLAFNVIYLAYIGELKILISPELLRLRILFNFVVLNIWPLSIGSNIWFIQSLAYAYLFFFLMEKLKLFKKYVYLPLLILLLVFMLFSGEFASVAGFPYFGYSYIPGGFLTKALPLMLVGMLIRKYVDRLSRIPRFVYFITFFAGILCAVGELFLLDRFHLLVYSGNTVGCVIMALSVCCYAVSDPDIGESLLGSHGGNYARRMYALSAPVSFLIWWIAILTKSEYLATIMQLQSVICFAVCFVLAFLMGWIKFSIALRKSKPNE